MTTSDIIVLIGLACNAAGAILQATTIENHVTIGMVLVGIGSLLAGYGYVNKTVTPQ